MRKQPGCTRPPLTEAQRKAKPPVSHPVFLTHPITGEKILYANPGYSMQINELPTEESDRILNFLFEHQLQPQFRYRHRWTAGDVLMWDNRCAMHRREPFDPAARRFLHRVVIKGTRPYGLTPA